MIVMHACRCEKPLARYGRFSRYGRAFREDDALAPPSDETVDIADSSSFEIPSPPPELDMAGLKTVVKTAVVFWAVTRILDHVFLGKRK